MSHERFKTAWMALSLSLLNVEAAEMKNMQASCLAAMGIELDDWL